ncbi:MAG: LPP20 family lipoprotein [Pseudomonadales bacterium]
MKHFIFINILIATALGLGACSSNTTIESDLGIDGAPDWVNEGTQAIDNDKGQLLHGVGVAPTMGDTSLQKNTADNRARAEIASILKTYIDSTLIDYTASVGDNADMNIEREIRTTTQLALSGSRILGYWKDQNNGDIYAFAELSLDAIDDLIATADNLSGTFKQFYRQKSNANFERFMQRNTAKK